MYTIPALHGKSEYQLVKQLAAKSTPDYICAGEVCGLLRVPHSCVSVALSIVCQVILGMSYDEKVDVWAIGCIFAELVKGEVRVNIYWNGVRPSRGIIT